MLGLAERGAAQSAGGRRWERVIATRGQIPGRALAVTRDASGNLYASGYRTNDDSRDVLVVKFDASGNIDPGFGIVAWSGGEDEAGTAIALGDRLYVAGTKDDDILPSPAIDWAHGGLVIGEELVLAATIGPDAAIVRFTGAETVRPGYGNAFDGVLAGESGGDLFVGTDVIDSGLGSDAALALAPGAAVGRAGGGRAIAIRYGSDAAGGESGGGGGPCGASVPGANPVIALLALLFLVSGYIPSLRRRIRRSSKG